jgi:hypothetical protein
MVSGRAASSRLWGRSARQLVMDRGSDRDSDSATLRGRAVRVAGSKPMGGSGLTIFSKALAATVQKAEISGF